MKYEKIKDIAFINNESIDKNYKEKYINYLDTSNITNGKIDSLQHIEIDKLPSRARRIVKINDIIYSTVRPNLCHYGILRKIEKNMVVSTGFVVLRCKNVINPEYLYAYLTLPIITSQMQSIAATTTSTYPSIKPSDIGELIIPIPNIYIQNKIANFLNSIDSKLELNNKINNNLQKLSSELYKRWFIDYEFPNEDRLPYKSFNGKMVDSEIGKIPSEWRIKSLEDLATLENGYSYKGVELIDESNIGMATIKNFERTGGFKLNGYKPLKPIKEQQQHYVDKYDLIVAHTDITQNADIIGNPVLILNKGQFDKIIISMDLVKVVSIDNNIDNFMLFEIINSKEFKRHALGYVTGTTVLHLNKDAIKDYKIALPIEMKLINKYKNIVKSNYEKISSILKENIILTKLRDTLLPKLMNGEIDLDEIDMQLK